MKLVKHDNFTSKQLSIIGSWSFLAGCGAFTYDSIIRKPMSKPYLGGCMLFNAGCVFHIMSAYR